MSSRQGSPRRRTQTPINTNNTFWTPRTSFTQPSKPEWNTAPKMSNANRGILAGELARLESNRARELVLDPEFVTFIYNYVKDTALAAGPNNFKGLGYNVEMITIVGGTALTLYDHLLGSVKNEYEIDHLKRYVERNTLDIDAVWCLPEYIRYSTFDARIFPYLDAFITQFNKKKPAILPHQITDMRCDKDISGIPNGTIHLKVFCMIDAVEYEVFDLSIHDSRSSQKYNEDYTKITKDMHIHIIYDPIYCSLQNTILLPFGARGIRVPRMDVFIRQQLFAFGNVILHTQGQNYIKGQPRPRSDKGYIHLRRVLYILHILSHIRPNNADSIQFLAAMQIYPMQYIQYIHEGIEIKRQAILHHLPQADKMAFNKKMDMIMGEFRHYRHEDVERPALIPRKAEAAAARGHSPPRHPAAHGHPPRIQSPPRPILPAHVPMKSVRSNHKSLRHALPKSASAQVDPLDEIDNIIKSNKGLISSFKSSIKNNSVKDGFKQGHPEVTDADLQKVENFFHNINYKPYNIFSKKNPKGLIGLMEGVIEIGPTVKEFIKYVQIPGLLPVVDELIMHLHVIIDKIKKIPNSGGRRKTQKKRSTRKR